jgi:hypothetical protein
MPMNILCGPDVICDVGGLVVLVFLRYIKGSLTLDISTLKMTTHDGQVNLIWHPLNEL